MKHDFAPWLDCLQPSHRMTFEEVFANLRDFTLRNPDAIDGGYRLEFRLNDAHVVVDRWMAFPVMGETPGVALHHDALGWDCTFSACTPVSVIIRAIIELSAHE